MIGVTRTAILFPLRPVAGADVAFNGVSPWIGHMMPMPAVASTITGVSRDSVGAALGGCTCTLLKVATNNAYPFYTQLGTTVSDGSGNYSFNVGVDGPYRVIFDLDGAPIRAGLTLKTLSGV
jgi:hypothetical protein